MQYFQIVSNLVIVCKNIHNLDRMVDWGRKFVNLKSKTCHVLIISVSIGASHEKYIYLCC